MESVVKKLKHNLRSGSSKRTKESQKQFLENGSIFLKELISDCNGQSVPIRSFSSSQILKATKNFDSKGVIEDRTYMIKRFSEYKVRDHRVKDVYKDIVLFVRMSNHNNFLKLLGCCLEFPFPVLVFEYAGHGVLNHKGGIVINGEESLLPWSLRLKIGKEIANALAYLHMAFPKIIIYRDVKPMHVFLDKKTCLVHAVESLTCDFSFSISIEEGKSQIVAEDMLGTCGYIDPLYFKTIIVTEYTDVYSFGVFLMVLLTRRLVYFTGPNGYRVGIVAYMKNLYMNDKLDEVIDPMIMKDIGSAERLQVEACVLLALRCCKERDKDRPKMIQVANELKQIKTLFNRSSVLI